MAGFPIFLSWKQAATQGTLVITSAVCSTLQANVMRAVQKAAAL
jgi:hypothetical protein